MVKQEILSDLKTLDPESFVSKTVIERVPYIFSADWQLYRTWRGKLADLLDVDSCDICLVGSASVGISLNPEKKFKEFDSESDIDIAVISPYHFDIAWRKLRGMRISKVNTRKERNAIIDHSKGLIFWGCIATDKILRFLPFATEWSRAAIEMASTSPTEGREINFRIYRDFYSLRKYQLKNVKRLGGD